MALPWLRPDPELGSPNGALNCSTCLKSSGPAQRAALHCGFMKEAEWAPGRDAMPKMFGPTPYTADVCPGWLARHQAVIDGADAFAALESRALHLLDPNETRVVFQAAMVMKRSLNLYQEERQKEIARRGGR